MGKIIEFFENFLEQHFIINLLILLSIQISLWVFPSQLQYLISSWITPEIKQICIGINLICTIIIIIIPNIVLTIFNILRSIEYDKEFNPYNNYFYIVNISKKIVQIKYISIILIYYNYNYNDCFDVIINEFFLALVFLFLIGTHKNSADTIDFISKKTVFSIISLVISIVALVILHYKLLFI